MEVIVPDEYLSIAIGKRGQNVRLASKLTGWHLDVKSETKYSEAMQTGYDSLIALPGVGISMADALYEKGFFSAEEIGNASIEDLIQIRGIGEGTAKKLITTAQETIISAETAGEAGDADQSQEETPEAVGAVEETDPNDGAAAETNPNDKESADS
jgi:N utilization substance protein A